jgi:hypothetical protein
MPTLKRLALRLQILFCSTFLLTAATVVQTAITLSAAGRAGTAGLIAATTEAGRFPRPLIQANCITDIRRDHGMQCNVHRSSSGDPIWSW